MINILLQQILPNIIYMKIWKCHTKTMNLKISAPTRNEEFELPDGSYFVSYIQDYFKYIIRKPKAVSNNSSIKIFVYKIENRITFRIKTGYYRQLLPSKTTKLPGSTNSEIAKDENVQTVPHLKITEVVLV